MKKRSYILVLIFSIIIISIKGQEKNTYRWHMSEGKLLFLEETWLQSLKQFLKAYEIDSSTANINYMIGCCYLKHPTSKHLAINYLERAVKGVSEKYDDEDPMEKNAPTMAYFYLAQAYHLGYRFNEALSMYEKYQSFINPKKYKDEINLIEYNRQMTNTAIEKVAKPYPVQIVNLGDSVNSEGQEFTPILSSDERMLLFTYAGTRTTGAIENKTINDEFFEDVFVSFQKEDSTWTKSKSISQNINTDYHDGIVAISQDNQTLIIYRDENGDGNLLYSTWDGQDWSVPMKFGNDINSKKWETSACLSPDGNTLYFVSNRAGGFGGKDIYRCRKINERWSSAENMGPKINTQYDEESPWLHPNGKDFFFSSKGHKSMGGYDVLLSRIDSLDNFSELESLPYPINTTDDDDFYIVSLDGKRAYYSSSHEDLKGFGEQDIYMVKLGNLLDKDKNQVLFCGKIVADSLPLGITIKVFDIESGEMIGLYHPQGNGNFSVILDPNKKYIFSYLYHDKEFMREEVPANDELTYNKIHREISLKNVNLTDSIIGRKAFLQVTVMNSAKDRKIVKGAKVFIKDANGKETEFKTNTKGVLASIDLSLGSDYSISASKGNLKSEVKNISTKNLKNNTLIKENLFLTPDKGIDIVKNKDTYNLPDTTKGQFTHYFEYNRISVTKNPNYKKFISEIEKKVSKNPNLLIKISSSASRVPTSKPGGNLKLSRLRADNMKYLLLAELSKKGIETKGLKFKITNIISGPKYKNDAAKRRRVYEKYQFVKVIF